MAVVLAVAAGVALVVLLGSPEKPARAEPKPEPRLDALAVDHTRLPAPRKVELGRLEEPRRFSSDPDAPLTLSLPSLGVLDAPVHDSDSPEALKAASRTKLGQEWRTVWLQRNLAETEKSSIARAARHSR